MAQAPRRHRASEFPTPARVFYRLQIRRYQEEQGVSYQVAQRDPNFKRIYREAKQNAAKRSKVEQETEITRWSQSLRMTRDQTRRDPAFKAAQADLRFYENLVRQNQAAGVPKYAGIDTSPDGDYAKALYRLGYRQYDDPWNVGDTPTFLYEDIAELLG